MVEESTFTCAVAPALASAEVLTAAAVIFDGVKLWWCTDGCEDSREGGRGGVGTTDCIIRVVVMAVVSTVNWYMCDNVRKQFNLKKRGGPEPLGEWRQNGRNRLIGVNATSAGWAAQRK